MRTFGASARVVALLLGAGLAGFGCGGGDTSSPTPPASPTPASSASPSLVTDTDPIVAAAGDIACGPLTAPSLETCHDFDTSELIVAMKPALVLALGDLQYEDAKLEDFGRYYDSSWGRFKPITRPAAGNHEYQLYADARGYFDYFNGLGVPDGPAGPRGRGYYSFNLGAWHVVALNSNCDRIGGCQQGSTQWTWLRNDLRASSAPCTLAYWHHPRFSSGRNGSTASMQAIWALLVEQGADLVLAGHDHSYERFARLDALGRVDARGVRQIVAGTGGRSLYAFGAPLAGSEIRVSQFGALRLVLRPRGYEWELIGIGATVHDLGADTCS